MLAAEEKLFYEKYAKWIKSLVAKFNKIELTWFAQNYRGIIATHAMEKTHIVLSVPKYGMIRLRMAKETPIGTLVIESKVHLF